MHNTVVTLPTMASSRDSQIQEVILCNLELFAIEDAIVLAEIYYETARTAESLYLLAHCLLRDGQKEAVYKLLLLNGQSTPRLRFLFALCCFHLNRLQEAEMALREENSARIHRDFEGTLLEPFAHSLLANIFTETGRASEAAEESEKGVQQNRLSWSNLKRFCDVGSPNADSVACKFIDSINNYRSISTPTPLAIASEIENTQLWKPPEEVSKPSKKEKRNPSVNPPNELSIAFAPKKRGSGAGRKYSEKGLARRRVDCSNGYDVEESERCRTDEEPDSTKQPAVEGPRCARALSTTRIPRFTACRNLRWSLRSVSLSSEGHAETVSSFDTPKDNSTTLRQIDFDFDSDVAPLSSSRSQNVSAKKPCCRSNSASGCSPFWRESQSGLRDGVCDTRDCSKSSPHSWTITELQKHPEIWNDSFGKVAECFAHLAGVWSAMSRFEGTVALRRLSAMPQWCAAVPLARELTARVHLEMGEHSKCAQILRLLHLQYPYRVSGMEILSTALWHMQEGRGLSMLASELTEWARLRAESWCVAGNCFGLQKQHSTAVECLERAILLNPRFAYAYSLLGQEFLEIAELDKAAISFRHALSLCPRDYRAWFGLGLMYFKREELPLARIHLRRAVAICPQNSGVLCQLSLVEQALHNTDTALSLLRQAMEISPDDLACRFYYARCLFDMRNYTECLKVLDELKVSAHDEAQVFFLLGNVHREMGNHRQAVMYFGWAAQIDPSGEQNQSFITSGSFFRPTSPSP